MLSKVQSWGYLILLMPAPLLTGIGEVLSREFPATDKFFGQPINIVGDVLLPSVMRPTIAMVLVGGLMGVAFAGRRANNLSMAVRVGLTMLALLALWVGVIWTYGRVISIHHGYWDLLFAPSVGLGLWTWVGIIETVGVALLSISLVRSNSLSTGNVGALGS